jgi:dinuclear metal center YbgI/SA1388 family protein
MANTHKIVSFLNEELRIDTFRDASHNGLQVANSGRVRKVCCGVDASLEFFEAARERGADMVICHHGISWGDSLSLINGLNYERVRFLIANDIALYACHLPLDAHPVHGNNAQICDALDLRKRKPFGEYAGSLIGFRGTLPKPVAYDTFKERVRAMVGQDIQTMDFGRQQIRRVAVISGGAADGVEEAAREGVDVFISGEPKLEAYIVAQQLKINAIFAGHYATEVFGPRALGRLVATTFGVKQEFIDFKIPF